MKDNYLLARERNPYHLSIGAVLINQNHEICLHYFKEVLEYKNLYILMRETINTGESIEECLFRGLKEEFGAIAEIESYWYNFNRI